MPQRRRVPQDQPRAGHLGAELNRGNIGLPFQLEASRDFLLADVAPQSSEVIAVARH
jgi:hypothetical protein